ncbi:MAG: low-affinity phosphate transporter [Peltula sp. TS41687]|nr:MAG: low-affinity phosphate transporter [Peltula sp. TS41687]
MATSSDIVAAQGNHSSRAENSLPPKGARLASRYRGGKGGTYHTRRRTDDIHELEDLANLRWEDKRQGISSEEETPIEQLPAVREKAEMKFSHSIQFNAVPDWSNYYIAYSNLKKLIYTLEKSIHETGQGRGQDAEGSPLLTGSAGEAEQVFRRALDAELEKICSFYKSKEDEILEEVRNILHEEQIFQSERETEGASVDHVELSNRRRSQSNASWWSGLGNMSKNSGRRRNTLSSSVDLLDAEPGKLAESTTLARSRSAVERDQHMDDSVLESVDDLRSSRDFRPRNRRGSVGSDEYKDQIFPALYESGIMLKKRFISLYVALCELRSFIQLNKTGFSKALKKFDKILDRDLRTSYMEKSVLPASLFSPATLQRLDDNISKIEKAYADVVSKGDVRQARSELRLHLREHVVWERNTVWRDLIGMERKAQAANLGLGRTLLGDHYDRATARLQGDAADDTGTTIIATPIGKFSFPDWLCSTNFFILLGSVAVFVTMLFVPILKKPEQQNCLAMLVFVSLLWATEVIPLFVTSLLVPFLVVVLRIVCSDQKPHHRLGAKPAAQYIFSAMWTPVIMLLLGGFTIAAALSKYHIAKIIATFVLSKAGTRPRTVLLTNMLVAMIASMWISNVAAPVLSFSIIQPILRNLPADSVFSRALILGIALAACIGGMASPIASPQNIIALEHMQPQPSWLTWFFIALPVCFISIIFIWLLLLVTFQPGKGTTIVPVKPVKDSFTGVHWFISLVSIGTILLWCVTHQIDGIVGDMGVVALIPLVLFFGTGILTKEDFNNFLWTIVILAAGGLALGKAVNSSGLLHTVANSITKNLDGVGLYGVFVVFAALILVVASFISHTVAALIVLPLVQQVGAAMDEPHPNLLVMGSALMCSAAMALPTSGFPNMTAIMMEDPQTGQRYLRVKHFISRGVPSSILTFLVVITVGYGLMMVVGF